MFQSPLKKLYLDNGVIDDKLLHLYCPDRMACWHDEETIRKMGAVWNKIQYPYIGKYYKEKRILFVGLNLRECGGANSIIDLFNGKSSVKESLQNNIRKMRFGVPTYNGTLIFHRLAVYAHILLNPENPNNDPYNLSKELADACEYIAFLEAVKCSPHDKRRCGPICGMADKCPKRYLFKEIEILKPAKIIYFDKNIFRLYLANIPPQAIVFQKDDKFICYRHILLNEEPIEVFYIIHPSWRRGGSSKVIGFQLKKFYRDIQGQPVYSADK